MPPLEFNMQFNIKCLTYEFLQLNEKGVEVISSLAWIKNMPTKIGAQVM